MLANPKAMKKINMALAGVALIVALIVARDVISMAYGNKSDAKQETAKKAEAPPRKPLLAYSPILQNNVFGIDAGELSKITVEGDAVPMGAAPTTTITLYGTIAWPDGSGFAILIGDGGRQDVFRRGAEVRGAGTLKYVAADHIVMNYSGRDYEVAILDKNKLDPSKATVSGVTGQRIDPTTFARRTSDTEYIVNKQAIEESINNPRNILTDARMLPFIQSGQQIGFSITEIKKGGLYEALGLQNGDVLLGVNSFKLTSAESALQAFSALKGMDSIELDITRQGKNTTLKYNIR